MSRLLSKRNTTALVDLTNEVETDIANKDTPSPKRNVVVNLSHSESSSDIEKDATDCNIVQTETSKGISINKHSIVEMPSANETLNVNQKSAPGIPERSDITMDVSSNAISENTSDKLDNINQTANLVVGKDNEKPGKETGELLSSDDCSTSNTTDELLEELGINERVIQSSPAPSPVNNISSGNLIDKSVDDPVPAVTGNAAVQDKTDKLDDLKTDEIICKKDEPTIKEHTPTPQVDATAPTSENIVNNVLVPGLDLTVKTELDDDMPDITDCSKLKSNELEENTQFTFHMLQEQIQQLQCKIETKELTCGDQVKISAVRKVNDPVYVSSDVDTDNDSPLIKTEAITETSQGDDNKQDSDMYINAECELLTKA